MENIRVIQATWLQGSKAINDKRKEEIRRADSAGIEAEIEMRSIRTSMVIGEKECTSLKIRLEECAVEMNSLRANISTLKIEKEELRASLAGKQGDWGSGTPDGPLPGREEKRKEGMADL